MTDEKIARINALAKKAKTEGLTDAEKKEQQELRAEYVADFRKSLKAQLDNTVVINPDGQLVQAEAGQKVMRLSEHAAHAIRRLERAGFEAWAVGGCVRDSLRGVEPHDWDLCTSASPAQMRLCRGRACAHDRTQTRHADRTHGRRPARDYHLPHGGRLLGRTASGRRALCHRHP